MYMDEGLDTGDILLQRKIDICRTGLPAFPSRSAGEIAPDALLDHCDWLASGNAPPISPRQKALRRTHRN